MESKPEKEIFFTDEELENISGFCSVLQKIHNRLVSEGYSIEDLRKQLSEKDVI